jgi:microcystin-dependent protein
MPIQENLLVTTVDLQQYLVDKDTGEALAAGIVTCYRDNARTVLKNWYYQSGVPGAYTYLALPNPLTLSGSGTVINEFGADVLPFYFPWNESDNTVREPYYITVDSSEEQRQFTRENWPFDPHAETAGTANDVLKNLIVNNGFWRAGPTGSVYASNQSEITFDLTNTTSTVALGGLCPSASDGFSMPNMQFFKAVTGAVETVSFKKFTAGIVPFNPLSTTNADVTPQYYVNHQCTAPQTSGETFKYYQWPIVLNIKNLEQVLFTFTIEAQMVGGSPNNQIAVGIYQFPGSGTAAPTVLFPKIFNLTPTWKKFTWTSAFPSASGITVNPNTGDDALYLVLSVPTGVTFNINFALPSIYLSKEIPANSFQTYDEVDSIINSPKTGDIRMSYNTFTPFGWIAANGNSIGARTSTAIINNSSTWQLYNLLWNNIPEQFLDISSAKGASAYADYIANKTMNLNYSNGRVIAALNASIVSLTFTTSSVTNLLVSSTATYETGNPVVLSTTGTLPTGLFNNVVYYAIVVDSTHLQLAATLDDATGGTPITFTQDATGTNTIQNALGGTQGTSTTSEVPNHLHTFTSDQNDIWRSGGGADSLQNGGTYPSTANNTITGTTAINSEGVDRIDLLQPTTFMNVFIKL